MSQEFTQQIRQLHNQALSELSQAQSRVRLFESDFNDDCNECWATGYEEALEIFENLVDDIGKHIRDLDIAEVMTSNPVVSENQNSLFDN